MVIGSLPKWEQSLTFKTYKNMKQKIRACRIVLSNGTTILDYFHNGNRGMAFAGTINQNYDNLWNGYRDEFLKACKEWIEKNKDNEDVEGIEIF